MDKTLNRLKQIRAYLGLTQAEFGKKIGMAGNSYSQIETGVNPLKERHKSLICHIFGVNTTWLITGKGEMLLSESRKKAVEELTDRIDIVLHAAKKYAEKKSISIDQALSELNVPDFYQNILKEFIAIDNETEDDKKTQTGA